MTIKELVVSGEGIGTTVVVKVIVVGEADGTLGVMIVVRVIVVVDGR